MKPQEIVQKWFGIWESGEFRELPITEDFRHVSPFGEIVGKAAYMELVEKNREKFLGYNFEIHDGIYAEKHACVRYTGMQGDDFRLDVSEWYYFRDGLIRKIFSYYHIGDIREDRKLE